MRLGLSATSPIKRRNGFYLEDSKYYYKATTTDFDDMTAVTVLAFASVCSGNTDPYGDLFGINQDATNDLGFRLYARGSQITLSLFATADGSGSMNTSSINMDANASSGDGVDTIYGRFGGHEVGSTGHKFQSTSYTTALVGIFDASATNDTKVLSVNSQGTAFEESNSNVANLGTMGTNGKIHAGYGGFGIANNPGQILHKICVWDSALSASDISKLTGRTVTFADSLDFDGNFSDVNRFKRNYSKIGVSTPTYEWDFSSGWENTGLIGNIVDEEGSVHNLTASGNPKRRTFIN